MSIIDHCILQPWLHFKQHVVRELAFVIASPPLLQQWPHAQANQHIQLPDTQFWQHHFDAYLPRLQQLDRDPSPLHTHLQQLRSSRLGLRFEALMAFWLQDAAYHSYQLIGKNIKLLSNQRTLGEIDFLLLNQDTQHVEHWEVAVKFYLGEGLLVPQDWLGLNRKDSLDRKLTHIINHQFSAEMVDQYQIQQRKAIIKGRLFYPPLACDEPDWLSPDHLKGLWGYTLPKADAHQLRYAYRQEWLCENPIFSQQQRSHQPHTQPTHPHYYREGLYYMQQDNQPTGCYMLRSRNQIYNFSHNTYN
jgi:hypothetical protein